MSVSRLPQDWKRPGCSDECERYAAIRVGDRNTRMLEIHDAEAHERWGSEHPTPRAAGAVVRTGALEVDFERLEARVGDTNIHLTMTEFRILSHFAHYPGRTMTTEEVVTAVWGPGWVDVAGKHSFRVRLTCLRNKLGPVRHLLTNPFQGSYALLDEPASDAVFDPAAWLKPHREKRARPAVAPRPRCILRGEAHPHALLTENDVRDIRKRAAAGESSSALAWEYGVSRSTVRDAVSGRTWKAVQP